MAYKQIFDLIYSALDKGEYEVAQKLCLKPEVAKFHLAQALLSYSYASLRQYDKALEIGRTLLKSQPTEDSIVNALGCTFKLCRSDDDFATCYENALKSPASSMVDHFHMELFSCYGRLLQPKKMQFVAQKLYKHTDQAKYIFWIVSSMVLQEDLPKSILAVAEKMLRKVFYEISPKKQPGAEELHLLMTVFILQSKYSDAIVIMKELLSRPMNNENKLQDDEHFQANVNMVAVQKLASDLMLLDLYRQTRQFHEAKLQALMILEDFPDQWIVHTFLNSIVLSSFPVPPSSMSMLPTGALSDLVCFDNFGNWEISAAESYNNNNFIAIFNEHLTYLSLKQSANPKLRGPFLANLYVILEYYVRYAEHSVPFVDGNELNLRNILRAKDSAVVTWVDRYLASVKSLEVAAHKEVAEMLMICFLEYLSKFNSKYCCYMDLKPILYKISLLQPRSIVTVIWEGLIAWIAEEIEQKQYVRDLLQLRNKAIAPETAVVEVKEDQSNINDAAKATTEGVEEEDGEDDEAEEEGKDNQNKESKGKGKKKKNRKSKAKKAKKANANEVAVVNSESTNKEPVMKKIDYEHLQGLVGKDEPLLVTICCYCQLDYIRSYIERLLEVPLNKESILTRYDLFDCTYNKFQDGVGGESRTVQPADDLQLVNSALHRVELKSLYSSWTNSFSEKKLDSEEIMKPMLSLVIQWCSTLSNAINSSKYSFPLKVDYMETSKILLNAPAVLHAFDNLGVKYVQNDTLSYLLVPALLEGGLFIESIKQYRTILQYYKVGRRETLDMLSRAFEYANYDKVLDLAQFVEESDKSLQLAVTKAELPLLEVVQKRLKVGEVITYLQDLLSNKLPESQPYFSEEAIRSLVSHLDLQILSRLDGFPQQSAEFTDEKNLRVLQILHRIKFSQELLQISQAFFLQNAEGLKQSRELLGALATVDALKVLENVDGKYLSFDQNIEGNKAFAVVHHQTFLHLLDFLMLTQKHSSGIHSEEKTDAAGIITVYETFEHSLLCLSEYLVYYHRISVGVKNGKTVVHPEYIRRVSALQRLLVTWGSLYFMHMLPTIVEISKDLAAVAVGKCAAVVENPVATISKDELFSLEVENSNESIIIAKGYWNSMLLWMNEIGVVKKTLQQLITEYELATTEDTSGNQYHSLIFEQESYLERLSVTNEVIAQAHNFSLNRLEGLMESRITTVLESLNGLIK